MLPEPVPMIARSKCVMTVCLESVPVADCRRSPVTSPATPTARGTPPLGFGQRQEHVVLGVGDRHDRRAVADAARPPRDLRDVEHRVAALHRRRVVGLGNAVSERRMMFGTPTSRPRCSCACPRRIGIDPAERDRKPAERLPRQVVVELAAVVAVQAGPVTALAGRPQTPACFRTAQPRPLPPMSPRCRRIAGPVQVEERAVEHQAGDAAVAAPRRRSRSSHSGTISPPAEWP